MTTPHPERQPDEEYLEDEDEMRPEYERRRYGEPQHEVTDEPEPDERMYGTPQHETGESMNDFELLLLERVVGPEGMCSEEAEL
ncbi:hypothetical protein [Haladaptatus halobius]|uniref:hypothetical protein n=1 Tax=Haladaptatus halobius TaxID=2884875 RepID=UPI001D0AEA51|nr:hypothetical protein [Haladaptatus halobius]